MVKKKSYAIINRITTRAFSESLPSIFIAKQKNSILQHPAVTGGITIPLLPYHID